MALIIFDTETTDYKGDVVELGSVILTNSGERFHFNERCKPNEPIQPGAFKCHGISNEAVANCRPSHVVVNEWYQDVLGLSEELIFCAHNLQFDLCIISQHIDITHHKMFCSLWAARRLFPEVESKALGNLYKHFGFSIDKVKAHSALDDCLMLDRILPFLVTDYHAESDFQKKTTEERAKPPKLLKKMPSHIKNHGGMDFNDIPEKNLSWYRDVCKNKDIAHTAGVTLEQRK